MKNSGCVWFIVAVIALFIFGNVYKNFSDNQATTPTAAPSESVPTAAADDGWRVKTNEEGLTTRTSSMTFEQCLAVRTRALAQLNVSPRKLIEIVNTNLMTITRVCLDDGKSLLITCSRPDAKMIISESRHTTDVGCPG